MYENYKNLNEKEKLFLDNLTTYDKDRLCEAVEINPEVVGHLLRKSIEDNIIPTVREYLNENNKEIDYQNDFDTLIEMIIDQAESDVQNSVAFIVEQYQQNWRQENKDVYKCGDCQKDLENPSQRFFSDGKVFCISCMNNYLTIPSFKWTDEIKLERFIELLKENPEGITFDLIQEETGLLQKDSEPTIRLLQKEGEIFEPTKGLFVWI